MLGTLINNTMVSFMNSFLTNYNRLLRGYRDEKNFNPQQVPYEVKMPQDLGTYYPKNQFAPDNKNYVDTQANSKYYFPQDFEPHYNRNNIYNNKPINDIGNQQNLYLSQNFKPPGTSPFDHFPAQVLLYASQFSIVLDLSRQQSCRWISIEQPASNWFPKPRRKLRAKFWPASTV